jgi:hypothetical protein
MKHQTLPHWLVFAMLLAAPLIPANAQQNPEPPAAGEQKPDDTPQSNRFWQASLPGGHYMVALDRISSVSRHKYVLDGSVIVDEVTVDALGQALARFYFIEPLSSAAGGNSVGATAGRLADRGKELLDRGASIAGTQVHEMVVKKFPETTHARTIEYRLLSEGELTALHNSVRSAWEAGRGRKFTVK